MGIITLKALLIVSSVIILIPAILIVSYQRFTEQKLLQLFEYNVNRSLCILYLENSSCNTLDFQLDYKRHQNSNYIPMIILEIICFFNYLTSQKNVKIFFGSIKLNNIIRRVVVKIPKDNCPEIFMQMLKNSSEIDMLITSNSWTSLKLNLNSCNLVVCSKDSTNSYLLLNNFFKSLNLKKNNISRLWFESLVTEHLNVELLVLQLLNGYRYVPDIYGTCGKVYFVEDCGHTLQYHLNKMNLNNRLLVAKELLTLALELTDGTAHSNYSFYITDLTADNIAIKLDKTSGLFLSLKIIDWSDVIIVANNNNITKSITAKAIHISEHIDCGVGCLAYSKDDICLSDISDHNIYAICKEFLSDEGKLLHGMSQAEEIKSLVNDCVLNLNNDNNFNKSRFYTVKLIITAIQKIVEQSDVNNNTK